MVTASVRNELAGAASGASRGDECISAARAPMPRSAPPPPPVIPFPRPKLSTASGPNAPSRVPRAASPRALRRVLDHRDSVRGGERRHGRNIRRIAIEMRDDDRVGARVEHARHRIEIRGERDADPRRRGARAAARRSRRRRCRRTRTPGARRRRPRGVDRAKRHRRARRCRCRRARRSLAPNASTQLGLERRALAGAAERRARRASERADGDGGADGKLAPADQGM